MSRSPATPEILVIDDEVQIRRLLRVTLEASGYRIREADSGQVGLTEVGFLRPDAVILDLVCRTNPATRCWRSCAAGAPFPY